MNGKNIIILALFLFIGCKEKITNDDSIKEEDKNGTWVKIQTPSDQNFNKVYFVNNDVGFVSSGYQLLKSINSGKDWEVIYKSDYWIKDFHFVSSAIGWIAIDKTSIIHTENGGETWREIITPGFVSQIFFLNSKVGWIGGNNIGVLTTEDNGITWIEQLKVKLNQTIKDIYFDDLNNGWVTSETYTYYEDVGVGGFTSIIYQTFNSGKLWEIKWSETGEGISNVQFFNNGEIGFLNKRVVLKSYDYGKNWEEKSNKLCTDLFFINEMNGWFITNNSNSVGYTSNGGINWEFIELKQDLNSIYFSDITHGWVASSNGVLFKYFK